MPEGDTIHRAAARLAAALVGREVVRYRGPRLGIQAPEPGTTIDSVEARGKYLLVRFGDGTALETHLRMNGSWHLYRPDERWRRRRGAARAIIETAEWTAVCFAAPHVVLRSSRSLEAGRSPLDPRRAGPERLGPDLTVPGADLDEVVERIDRFATDHTHVVTLLLDQRVFAGVGNVFKSEVLFACAVHPETPVGALSPALRRRLAQTATTQLQANLGPGPRTTVPEGLAVYDRAGRVCRRCDASIVAARHGTDRRITFWCPSCQPVPGAVGDPGSGPVGRAQPAPGRTTPDS